LNHCGSRWFVDLSTDVADGARAGRQIVERQTFGLLRNPCSAFADCQKVAPRQRNLGCNQSFQQIIQDHVNDMIAAGWPYHLSDRKDRLRIDLHGLIWPQSIYCHFKPHFVHPRPICQKMTTKVLTVPAKMPSSFDEF